MSRRGRSSQRESARARSMPAWITSSSWVGEGAAILGGVITASLGLVVVASGLPVAAETLVDALSAAGLLALFLGHAWSRLGQSRQATPIVAALFSILAILGGDLFDSTAVFGFAMAGLLATCIRIGWVEFRHDPLSAAGFLTLALPLPILLVIFLMAGVPSSSAPPSRETLEGTLVLALFGPIIVGAFLVALGKVLHWRRGDSTENAPKASRRKAIERVP